MALAQRVDSLRKRHAEIEDALHREVVSPAGDDLVIAQMKREKLFIKDELNRLETGNAGQAA